MPMKNTIHSGRIVREDCLEPHGLRVTEAATVLGVTLQALNNVVNQKSGISPEIAVRVSKAFGNTPKTWVRVHAAFDLAVVQKRAIEGLPANYRKVDAPDYDGDMKDWPRIAR